MEKKSTLTFITAKRHTSLGLYLFCHNLINFYKDLLKSGMDSGAENQNRQPKISPYKLHLIASHQEFIKIRCTLRNSMHLANLVKSRGTL
jgi:hypothetical protein